MENKNNIDMIVTGYPHIDKPWMKYYDQSKIETELPQMTIYDYMLEKSKPAKDMTAITYYGKEITYDEFAEKCAISSKVFDNMRVKTADRIMYLMPNIPETAYTFYGSTQIGGVADYIDPRPDSVDLSISAKKVLTMIRKENIKYLVCLDQCYLGMIKPIENELKDFGIESIVLVSATDSMEASNKLKYLIETANFEGLKTLKAKVAKSKIIAEKVKEAVSTSPIEIIYYKDIERECRNLPTPERIYTPDQLAAIVHSSGTTSITPKPIPLTHDNLNAYVQQSFTSNMPPKIGDRTLHVLPYFAAYGLSNVVHAGFCQGNNMIQIPEFSPANLGKLIKKYNPQTIIGTPSWFLQLTKDKSLSKKDLSFLTMVTYGGDTMEIADEYIINDFLKKHNSQVEITKGHGMSEVCGCSSYSTGEYNIPGVMGIPLSNTTYAIVDPETRELVRFEDGQEYIEGELIISSKTATTGELDGVKYVEHVTIDGQDFIYTKDIARMDRNGIMTFLSRSDRSFTRFDGYKLKPFELEKLIKEYPGVKYCVISPYFDETKTGNMPLVNIVLEDGIELTDEQKVEFVKNMINSQFIKNKNISSRQIPSRVKIREAMPLTKNGKVDFKALEVEGLTGEEVIIDIEETNISIGEIKIYMSKKNTLKLKK